MGIDTKESLVTAIRDLIAQLSGSERRPRSQVTGAAEFGRLLKSYREEMGIRRAWLAEKLGMHPQTLYKWEPRGIDSEATPAAASAVMPTVDALRQLLEFLTGPVDADTGPPPGHSRACVGLDMQSYVAEVEAYFTAGADTYEVWVVGTGAAISAGGSMGAVLRAIFAACLKAGASYNIVLVLDIMRADVMSRACSLLPQLAKALREELGAGCTRDGCVNMYATSVLFEREEDMTDALRGEGELRMLDDYAGALNLNKESYAGLLRELEHEPWPIVAHPFSPLLGQIRYKLMMELNPVGSVTVYRPRGQKPPRAAYSLHPVETPDEGLSYVWHFVGEPKLHELVDVVNGLKARLEWLAAYAKRDDS